MQIEAAIPTAPGNGVEENPASEARATSHTTDWDEPFARREQIKAGREKRVHSKKSILRMKTAFIDCAEANFLFVVAICIVLS